MGLWRRNHTLVWLLGVWGGRDPSSSCWDAANDGEAFGRRVRDLLHRAEQNATVTKPLFRNEDKPEIPRRDVVPKEYNQSNGENTYCSTSLYTHTAVCAEPIKHSAVVHRVWLCHTCKWKKNTASDNKSTGNLNCPDTKGFGKADKVLTSAGEQLILQ